MAYGVGGQGRVEPDRERIIAERARIAEQRQQERAEKDQFEEARALINQAANQDSPGTIVNNNPFLGGGSALGSGQYVPQGIASIGIGVDDFTNRAMIGGYDTRGDPRESFGARDVAIDELANMGSIPKGIHNIYAKMFGLDMDDQGNITPEALIDLKRQTRATDDAYWKGQESRKRDQDREMARLAALAQQQTQPVDPCPEGYRLDLTTNTCVPTDDTTDPDEGTGRVYETMTEPQENYTQASPYTVPTINLPDIFTGN